MTNIKNELYCSDFETELNSETFSYFYGAYGLKIGSNIEIPDFNISEKNFRKINFWIKHETSLTLQSQIPPEVFAEEMALKTKREETLLYVKDTGAFYVKAGREIIVIPAPRATLGRIRQVLLGRAIAIALSQRGQLVLHGSGVKIGDAVALFLADSGEGKSTLAAALHLQGHPLMTDDVAAIDLTDFATIAPTFPRIKLAKQTGEALGYSPLGKVDSPLNKHWYPLDLPSESTPLPVGAIYILTTGSTLQIEPLPPQTALTTLMRHSVHNLWFHQQEAKLFLQCANLAQKVAVYRLQRPRNLGLLSQTTRSLEDHFMSEQI